jgi:electron transfer flavoprotein alpha subunit
MATFWAVGEVADGAPTRLTLELATLAGKLAADSGGTARTILVGSGAADAAAEAAKYGDVLAVDVEGSDQPTASLVAPRVAALIEQQAPDYVLVGASNDGKDVAGMLLGLTDLPILVNVAQAVWKDDAPHVEMSTFGGRLLTKSTLTAPRGLIVVRPSAVTAEEVPAPGKVDTVSVADAKELPTVRVVDRVEESAAAVPIEESRIIVGGGRGLGNPDGFRLIEELAQALGGAVGATRAVVDAGWINYSQQIGQTGKTVKPALYLACGISGAIQHKVGVQTAGTIVAINKDAEAPIADFADMVVVGDLFAIIPPLIEAVKARKAARG